MDFSALLGHQDMLSPGNADVARLRADAIPLLRQIDEREHLQTQKVLPLAAGMWNALYRLEPAGVVAKLSAEDNSFEVNFLRQAASLTIPVPQVLGAGKLDHAPLPNATYFLMTYIPNSVNGWMAAYHDHAMPHEAILKLGDDLGTILATLHQVHLGYITRFGMRVDRWQRTLTDGFSPDWDNIAPNALFDDRLLPVFKNMLDQTGYFDFKDGTLVHGDLVLSNVLLDANTYHLNAIIDPGGYAGMPMFDLAYAAMPWHHGFVFLDAILKAYQQHSTKFDQVLFYTSMLVVAYRHDRFHTAAMREFIEQDVLPRLRAILP